MPVNGSDPAYPGPTDADTEAPGMDIRTEATRGFMRDILRYQLENNDLYDLTLSNNAISPKEEALADQLLSHAARLADRATDALIAELNKPEETEGG